MSALFRLTPPKVSENDVEHAICSFLAARGWLLVRNHIGKFVPLRTLLVQLDALDAWEVTTTDARRTLLRAIIQIGEEGRPDWLALHADHPPLWIEVKAPGRKPTEAQLARLAELQRRGFRAGWWDSGEQFARDYARLIHAETMS